jgi:hypothetical protein
VSRFLIAQIVLVVLAGVLFLLPVPIYLGVGCTVLSVGCGIIVLIDDRGIA